MSSIIGNRKENVTIDRSLVDKLNEEARRNKNARKPSATRIVDIDDDYLTIADIRCVGSDGAVMEEYDRIMVSRLTLKRYTWDEKIETMNHHQAIEALDERGYFLPSLPLQCAILTELYRERQEEAADELLQQYYSDDYRGKLECDRAHHCNTLYDATKKIIIHYPCDEDYPHDEECTSQRTSLRTFGKRIVKRITGELNVPDYERQEEVSLLAALEDANNAAFLRDLTGLQDPSILYDVGQYLKATSVFRIPRNGVNLGSLGGARIEGWSSFFEIGCGCNNLAYHAYARGVKEVER